MSNLKDDPAYQAWKDSVKPHGLAKRITHAGVTRTYKGWALHLGVSVQTIKDRVRKKWTPEQITTTPQKVNQYK